MRNDRESVQASSSDAVEPTARTAWIAPSIEDVSIGNTAAKKKSTIETSFVKNGS